MSMDQEDLELLNTLKTTRQNITALELGGTAERIAQVAVEGLQEAIVGLDGAITREDLEEVEAEETLLVFRQARTDAIALLSKLIELLKRALYSPGADFPEMRTHRIELRGFLDEHQPESLKLAKTSSLAEDGEQVAAFLPIFVPLVDPHMDLHQTRELLLESMAGLLNAQEEFMREESQYVDATRQLEQAREVAYINMLNARDIMRASLRLAQRLSELNEVVPKLNS